MRKIRPLRPPTEEEIRNLGQELYLDLTENEIQDYRELIMEMMEIYGEIRSSKKPENRKISTDRKPGHRAYDDNPYNAWITRCEVESGEGGPLEDWQVALKDNIALGGIQMTCGSQILEGYIPNTDATIVTRLLDAGACIVGKTNMDDMAFTGNGHSSAFGPTLNPINENYLAGGSSGGSAAVVANDEVDLAIGCDQGGSIRAPSSWTGIVGLKPTYGLISYTGIVGIENTIDHAGPMARDVSSVARALTVLAGKDPDDPRQPKEVPTEDFETALNEEFSDLSIGVVKEGFTREESDRAVNETVRNALDTIVSGKSNIQEISVPMHESASSILFATLAEGALASLVWGDGVGKNWKGWYNTSFVDAFGKFRRSQGGDFAPSLKLVLLLGAYMNDQYHSKYYAEAMNLRRTLKKQYEKALKNFDVLAMPTTPQTAHKYKPDQDRFEFIADAWGSLDNTGAFNMTGHPAITVPAGTVQGLPVGLMFVGKHWDDATVLKAAHAVEKKVE